MKRRIDARLNDLSKRVYSAEGRKQKIKLKKVHHMLEKTEKLKNKILNSSSRSNCVTTYVDNEEGQMNLINVKTSNRTSVLSSISSFYELKEDCPSEEDEEGHIKLKKNDLSVTEEKKVAIMEMELADTLSIPQSADQFDKLLLAHPNSSQLWLRYISMHVAAAELEKARAIGKRAIETISLALLSEKLNIWIGLLNLENMYGTKESLEEIFTEAIKHNDSSEIYLRTIKMFASSGKLSEMEQKINKFKPKIKQNAKLWLEIGRVYYSLQKLKEARNIKEVAIKSILDCRKQFDLILQFGIVEFQIGDFDQAVLNFETLLDIYPRKINIWIIYLDQLVKRQRVELARKLLNRGIHQKFGTKSMKTIFQKFIAFEERYGSLETVASIKSQIQEYVTNAGSPL